MLVKHELWLVHVGILCMSLGFLGGGACNELPASHPGGSTCTCSNVSSQQQQQQFI